MSIEDIDYNKLSEIDLGISKDELKYIDYENFSMWSSCSELYRRYEENILSLRAAHYGAELQLSYIRATLLYMIYSDYNPEKSSNPDKLNSDLGASKIVDPQKNKIPKCMEELLSSVPNIDISTSTQESGSFSGFGDILDFNDLNLDFDIDYFPKYNFSVDNNMQEYISNIEDMIKEAKNLVEKSMEQLLDKKDLLLFKEVDILSAYLDDTNYINKYKLMLKQKKCLEENCKSSIDIMTKDDFLWEDSNKTQFIMPIDLTNSKITFHKFLDDPSSEETKRANAIEVRYYKYIRDKNTLINNISINLENTGISEDINPFKNL